MGNIGWSEILIILVVAVFLFGPEKLPQFIKKLQGILRALGKLRDEAMKTVEPIERELKQGLIEDTKKTAEKSSEDAPKTKA